MNAPAATKLNTLQTQAPREANLPAVAPGFGSLQSFELALRQAKLLSSSTLVPAQYRQFIEKNRQLTENTNAIPNCVIAMNMAQRMGADPLMVMQNLYIVEGRPSWSSQWIIAAINGCGRFSPLRFDLKDLGPKEVEYTVTEWIDGNKQNRKVKATVRNMECVAWAIEKETGERITSPTVSMEMAVKEGWYAKNGSKWQTMPEVMLRYRTASFFGKLYAPELLMGLQTVEEMHDILDAKPDGRGGFAVDLDALRTIPTTDAPEGGATPSPSEKAAGSPGGGEEPGGAGKEAGQGGSGETGAEGTASSGSTAQPPSDGGPTFEDAIAAVQRGEIDFAKEVAAGLPDGQRQQVEQAIANRQGAAGQQPASKRATTRGQQQFNVE